MLEKFCNVRAKKRKKMQSDKEKYVSLGTKIQICVCY